MPTLICILSNRCGHCINFKRDHLDNLKALARSKGITVHVYTTPDDDIEIRKLPNEIVSRVSAVPAFFFVDDRGHVKNTSGYQSATDLINWAIGSTDEQSRYYLPPPMRYR